VPMVNPDRIAFFGSKAGQVGQDHQLGGGGLIIRRALRPD
jgi:hypothetical protein